MAADRIQVYRTRGGTLVFRRLPTKGPSSAQLEIQAKFREAVQSARGSRMRGRLPPGAEAVQQQLRGVRTRRGVLEENWPRVLRKWLMELGFTEDEAKDVAGELAVRYKQSR